MMDETNVEDSFESARGDCTYEDSENSKAFSEASYAFQNDTPHSWGDSWDNDYDDSYYDLTYASDEEKYQVPLVTLDHTEMEHESNVERTAEMQDEALEENNNDPNNNMDSIEIDELPSPPVIRSSPVVISDSDETAILSPLDLPISKSPKPGCSKDCVSLPDEKPREEILLEKTRYILSLLSRIHRDSIFDALARNTEKPVSQLKLWDLIPETSRLEYPQYIVGPQVRGNIAIRGPGAGGVSMKIKRGPEEDICTIGCKRSSSTPDISHSAPMTQTNSIPKVPSSSQIAKASNNSVGKSGAFVNNSILPFNDLMDFTPMETERSIPISTTKIPSVVPLTKNSNAIPATITSTAIPATKISTAIPATKISTAIPATKTSNAIPATKTSNAIPATKTSTAIPATKTSNAIPAMKTSTAIPATKTSNAIPVLKPMTAIPAARRSTAMSATKTSTAIPATKTSTAIPERKIAVPAADRGAIPKVYADPGTKYGNQGRGKPLPVSHAASTRVRPKSPAQRISAANHKKSETHRAATVVTAPTNAATVMTNNGTKGNPAPLIAPPVLQTSDINRPINQPNAMPQHTQQRTSIKYEIVNEQRMIMEQVRQERLRQQVEKAQQLYLQKTAQGSNPAADLAIPQAVRPLQETQEAPQPVAQNATRPICMEIYYKLINIFPNVERNFIKSLCPAEWTTGDRDGQLSILIENILERGETVPRIDVDPNEYANDLNPRLSTVDEIYENLLGIFPDADPHFLRESAESNLGKPDALKAFVEAQLERRDYPTREEYMARLKITEQQRQYTEGFDVKQYLSIIPDPVKQFIESERNCKHSTVALEFLKSHFNKMRVTTISKYYSGNLYNLSKTAASLEALGSELKSKRWYAEMLTADILLLQEIAFIKHKKKIIDYLANLKKTEEAEFKTLKEQKLLLECQCCYDSECVPSKCSNCDNGHIFCNNCVVTGTSAKMGDGETRINCFINCGSEFSLSVLQRVLAPTTFSILLKKRQAAEVIEAGLEGLVSCPFCHFASIPPEEDKIFKCLNPECTKESCRLCKELSHVPLKCDEVMKTDRARHFIEEKMTEALARKCYKCQKSFFKEEGCNKITCVCGAIMCYLCDEPIKDYSHFRGQGSDNKNLCPLYSDTIRLDAVAVRKIAEEAKLEVMKMNPNIKIDTASLLPDVPRPRAGPHQNVIDADELPRRAQRTLARPPI